MVSAKISLLDQLIVSGSNFLIVVLIARFLDPVGVAKYAYAFGFYMFLYMVANAWIYQNIMAIGRQALEVDGLISNFARLNLILVLISFPVSTLLFQLVISSGHFDSSWVEASLVALFIAVNQMIDFERRVLYFLTHSPLKGPATISFTVFLIRIIAIILIQPDTFVEFMVTLIVFSLPGLYFSARHLPMIFKGGFYSFVQQQLKSGKWMTVNIPINWAWGQAPVFVVGLFLGLQSAGVYAAIRSIANLANVAMELIPTYFASRLSNLFTSGKLGAYKRYMLIAVASGILVWGSALIMLALVGEDFLAFILGDGFSSYWFLLCLFWGFNIFVFLSRLQFLHFRFVEKTVVTPVAHLGGVLALSGSYFLWFSGLGVEGMAWAMIVGGSVIVSIQFMGILLMQWDKGYQ